MSDISIYVTSNLTSSERRISPQWDLHYLKTRLELITGIEPKYQTIQYYPIANSNESRKIADSSNYNEQADKEVTVTQFNIVPFSRLHVIDTNPDSELAGLDEDNISPDAEFKLSEEEYAKKTNTVLSWKQNNKLGRFNPEFDSAKVKLYEENLAIAETMKVGQRCRVINIGGERRGVVKYIGKIEVLDKGENIWVGVEFDEPTGKNNGSIDGVKIFEAKPGHGSFLKPKQVEVGDFPELDPFMSDEDDDEL
ncbi:CAP Gly-rich domain-containing protein [Scheffersomyces xylosifermentans]|uniref:CAP Gly-rich domain-containing protein n=1 Tax=Scheffersomyces xylosifermentans TaxID=1304137 RepID=UPI00315DC4ED